MKKNPSRLTDSLIEMAKDMQKVGLLDKESCRKMTMRLLKKEKLAKITPMKSDEIRAIREREHLSQAVFANYLNLSVGFVSQLERGLKTPKGPLLVLLHTVDKRGVKAIL